ncbi:MAG: amidase [Gemmatimonadota bacterium]
MSLPFPDYEEHDALALAEQVRSGQRTPAELVEAAEARIQHWNPVLNGRVHDWSEHARKEASGTLPQGPLRGVPYLLKDLLSPWAGRQFTAGSRFLQGFRPTGDGEMVRRYRASGAICLGRTNTPELGLVPVTEPEFYGPTRNPWDLERTPGGSSGGSAALVAAGCVPFAGGGDGGGSIRIPASCCGLFGLKPTRNRTPSGPDSRGPWHGLVVEHVLTRSVRDSAAVLDALAGPEVGGASVAPAPARPFLDEASVHPGKLRIGWTGVPLLGPEVDPACLEGLAATVDLLKELGHKVEEVDLRLDQDLFSSAFVTMVCGEVAGDLAEAERWTGRTVTPGDVEPATWALGLLGRSLSAGELSTALRTLHRTSLPAAQLVEDFDLLLTPTLASPPVKLGVVAPKPMERLVLKVAGRLRAGGALKSAGMLKQLAGEAFRFTPYTPVFNVTGHPAMSVPLHWTDGGLPVGMHFVSRFGDEATLLRLAGQLETVRPWAARRPPFLPAEVSRERDR